MYRYTLLFTSKEKRPMYVHLVLRTFIEMLCCEQFKNLSRFKFNEVDQRVLFIATSDDPKWLKANLRGVNNDLYFSADLFAGKILSFFKRFLCRNRFESQPGGIFYLFQKIFCAN